MQVTGGPVTLGSSASSMMGARGVRTTRARLTSANARLQVVRTCHFGLAVVGYLTRYIFIIILHIVTKLEINASVGGIFAGGSC